MSRWISFTVGAVTFLAAHVIEILRWSAWFGGGYQPWFLNSGAAVAFTLGCVFAASIAAALSDASARPLRGVTMAVGSFAAMTIVMFLKEGGPGTIFPIVLAVGGVLILVSSTLGALLGREVRRAVKGR